MRLERLLVVDLIEEDTVLAPARHADVEPPAALLVAPRGLGVRRHEGHEGGELPGSDLELDGDDVALHLRSPVSRSRIGAPISSARMPGSTGMKGSPWPR